jgi:hypothetical protein
MSRDISRKAKKERKMKETLRNIRCSVEYDPNEKQIFCRDLTDTWNEPAFYSKSKRGLKIAWAEVKFKFTAETVMHDVLEIMRTNNIKTHYWCMID